MAWRRTDGGSLAPLLSGIPDYAAVMKKGGGFQELGIEKTNNGSGPLEADETLIVPRDSMQLGHGNVTSAAGALIMIRSLITGRRGLFPWCYYDPATGTGRVLEPDAGVEQTVSVNPTGSDDITSGGTLTITTTAAEFIHNLILFPKAGDVPTGFRMRATVQGQPDAFFYWPTRKKWSSGDGGTLPASGEIDLDDSPMFLLGVSNPSDPITINVEYEFKSGALKGVGSLPGISVKRNVVTLQELARRNEVTELVNHENVRYVGKHGSDSNNGKNPGAAFLTIQAALNSITDAAGNKRYVVLVMPGDYSESITGKNNIEVMGFSLDPRAVVLSGNNTVLTTPNTYSNYSNLTLQLTNPSNFTQNTVFVNGGEHYMRNCVIAFSSTIVNSSLDVIEVDAGFLDLEQCQVEVDIGDTATTGNIQITHLRVDGNGSARMCGGQMDLSSRDSGCNFILVQDNSSDEVRIRDVDIGIEIDDATWAGYIYVFGFFGSHTEHIQGIRVNAEKSGGATGAIYPVYANSLSATGADVEISDSKIAYSGFSGSSKMVHVDQSDDVVRFTFVETEVDGTKANFSKSGNGTFYHTALTYQTA